VTSSRSTAEPASVRGRAFGLAIRSDFAVPGLGDCDDHGEALPTTDLRLTDEARIARLWRDGEAASVSVERDARGEPERTIDAHPEGGYRIYARSYGLCVIARDGSRLLCAPPSVASWRWQRLLVGRCLPIASLLRGYEVLHAAAVAIDQGVVAIAGPTAAGKTSLAVRLTQLGATFFTDDVLAVKVTAETVAAYPGPGVVNVRAAEHNRLGADERRSLGDLLGRTGADKLHYALPAGPDPLPLRRLYFLRSGEDAPRSSVQALRSPDPLRLLTSTFLHQIRRPEHLERLLDVCARLSADVPMFEVVIGSGEDATTLAGRLRDHIEEGVAS
jgi:hypothetical protein